MHSRYTAALRRAAHQLEIIQDPENTKAQKLHVQMYFWKQENSITE